MPIPHLQNRSKRQKLKTKTISRRVPKSPKKKKSWLKRIFWWTFYFGLFCFIAGSLALAGAIAWFSRDLPNPNKLIERQMPLSTKIYDRTGKHLLYEIHGSQQRTFVPISKIPPYVIDATIAIEDKDFWEHPGFSLWGMFRGVVITTLEGKRMEGGSTITQQFIKNAILTNRRTVKRKIKELILAWRMEHEFTKKQILQLYFNEIPYGSTAYGVEAASEMYFGKHVQDLTLAEAAILAALPQAPTYYSPYGSHRDALFARQRYILKLMYEQGYIDKQQYEHALAQKIKFKPRKIKIIAPHFVMYVKQLLTERYGERMTEEGGLQVITTLDLSKQKKAEEAIKAYADRNAKIYHATNEALVAIDPKTGQILAMVGSRNYFDMKHDGNVNVAICPRQPGSSLKSLVYATAFSLGYPTSTVLYDVKTNFGTPGSKPYVPLDYDGKFRGPVTMEKALAGSLNIPAVKTLYLVGIPRVLQQARMMGYTTFTNGKRYGLSFVLGGAEVKLLEHVNAYGVFARDGIYHPVTAILEIKDSHGRVIEKYHNKARRVMSAQAVEMLNQVLSSNKARAYMFDYHNYLNLGKRPVAAKTGTTNDFRDAWTIGYTPSLVAGVWVGNNNDSPMRPGAEGAVVAAPIWHKFMLSVLGPPEKGAPVEKFTPPKYHKPDKPILDGKIGKTVTLKIDRFSQKLATQYTPPAAIEEKKFTEIHSILYYVQKDNPLGPPPANPASDPQYPAWEKGVQDWVKQQIKQGKLKINLPPTTYDNVHIPANKPKITILAPFTNQTITQPFLNIQVQASAPRGVQKVKYFLDNKLIAVASSSPFSLRWQIKNTPNGEHTLTAVAYDDVLNSANAKINLNFQLPPAKVNLIWLKPNNNSSLSAANFPLDIQIALSASQPLKKIDFYSLNLNSGEKTFLGSVLQPNQKIINFLWQNPPFASGRYEIIAVTTDLNYNQETLPQKLTINYEN